MNEHNMYKISIRPKKYKKGDEVYEYRFVADNAVEALTKMMALPDISYLYDYEADTLVIEFEGKVY